MSASATASATTSDTSDTSASAATYSTILSLIVNTIDQLPGSFLNKTLNSKNILNVMACVARDQLSQLDQNKTNPKEFTELVLSELHKKNVTTESDKDDEVEEIDINQCEKSIMKYFDQYSDDRLCKEHRENSEIATVVTDMIGGIVEFTDSLDITSKAFETIIVCSICNIIISSILKDRDIPSYKSNTDKEFIIHSLIMTMNKMTECVSKEEYDGLSEHLIKVLHEFNARHLQEKWIKFVHTRKTREFFQTWKVSINKQKENYANPSTDFAEIVANSLPNPSGPQIDKTDLVKIIDVFSERLFQEMRRNNDLYMIDYKTNFIY